jgi:hypothetical protein
LKGKILEEEKSSQPMFFNFQRSRFILNKTRPLSYFHFVFTSGKWGFEHTVETNNNETLIGRFKFDRNRGASNVSGVPPRLTKSE